MHSGGCVAGVVGTKIPHYSIFGETVEIAGLMESSGEPMKIQVCQRCPMSIGLSVWFPSLNNNKDLEWYCFESLVLLPTPTYLLLFYYEQNLFNWNFFQVVSLIILFKTKTLFFHIKVTGFCYHTVNIICFHLYQSDHIKRHPLFLKLTLLFPRFLNLAKIFWRRRAASTSRLATPSARSCRSAWSPTGWSGARWRPSWPRSWPPETIRSPTGRRWQIESRQKGTLSNFQVNLN